MKASSIKSELDSYASTVNEFLLRSLDGKPNALKAGDLLYMPPNLPHAVTATTQFSMLLTLSKPGHALSQSFTKLKQ